MFLNYLGTHITTESLVIPFAYIFEVVGLIILVWGGFVGIKNLLKNEFFHTKIKGNIKTAEQIRLELGHKIVFALEFFLVGDLIRTVIAPSMSAIIQLGVLALIRTTLGYFLTKEL